MCQNRAILAVGYEKRHTLGACGVVYGVAGVSVAEDVFGGEDDYAAQAAECVEVDVVGVAEDAVVVGVAFNVLLLEFDDVVECQ